MSEKIERNIPKWEVEVRERLKNCLRKFNKPLADLVARDANEGDTRLLVTDFLCEALGYDKYTDLTTEYRVKGEFADFGIRIEQDMTAFIEVKRITTKLNDKHLRQVQSYAVNEGVEWMLLTNGVVWQVYRLTAGLPIITDLVLEVNLLSEETSAKKADKLFYLTKESLKRRQIEELWKARTATSPQAFAKVLFSYAVIDQIRKEIKRQSGHNITSEEISKLLKDTVIKPECF